MALYHTSMRVFGRAQGVSAVAATPYRAGAAKCDACTGPRGSWDRNVSEQRSRHWTLAPPGPRRSPGFVRGWLS
jgi:hypothetical protein